MKVLIITTHSRNYHNWIKENGSKVENINYYFINSIRSIRGLFLNEDDEVIELYDSSEIHEIEEILEYIESHTLSNYKRS